MIEAFVLGVIGNVLSNYISGLLTEKQTARSRAELVSLVESKIRESRALDGKPTIGIAVRELDAIVDRDRNLAWRDDCLVVRPSGRIRKTLPSPEEALNELVASVTARRRELGLPLTADDAASPASKPSAPGNRPVEGELIPPAEADRVAPEPDLLAEVMNLPSAVLREKDRRRREASGD